MKIEQSKPNKPNFALVVALAGIVMLLLFVVAYFTLDWDGKHLVPHHQQPHPTSQLILPHAQTPAQLA